MCYAFSFFLSFHEEGGGRWGHKMILAPFLEPFGGWGCGRLLLFSYFYSFPLSRSVSLVRGFGRV